MFTKADWQPKALVVVGSAGGFESILPQLEDALSVPVYAPEEAELALARGAALASAQTIELPLVGLDDGYDGQFGYTVTGDGTAGRHRTQERRTPFGQAGAATLLIAGVLTFVVSVSIAVSVELTPRRDAGPGNPVPAVNVSETPAAVKAIPPAMPPPVSIPAPEAVEPALPLPEAPVVDDAGFVGAERG